MSAQSEIRVERIGLATLYLGDCRDILPTLPPADAVITDPPYGMGWVAGSVSKGKNSTGGSFTKHKGARVLDDDKKFDPSAWIKYRKAVLFGSNHFAASLPVGTTLVWIKRREKAFGSFLSDAEIAWMKGGHGVYCRLDTSDRSESRKGERFHPTQKPVSIMEWCMDKAKVPQGATVLDPYMGSGTTGIACIRTGRKFIGIELDAGHFATARARLENELRQGLLPLTHNTRITDSGKG